MSAASSVTPGQSSLAKAHAELVRAVATNRDRAAFAELFDFYAPRLEAFLIRLALDAASAEEVTQEVMTTLWRKADLFDPAKSSVATWLYRIARNRRIDLSRRNRVDLVDPGDFQMDVADDTIADAGELIDTQRREEILRKEIAGLPPEQLALVKMAFYESLSHSEIAGKTGLPLGTVKSRLRLAFTRLRRALETRGIGEAG